MSARDSATSGSAQDAERLDPKGAGAGDAAGGNRPTPSVGMTNQQIEKAREALLIARDYVSDAAERKSYYSQASSDIEEMGIADLATLDAALTALQSVETPSLGGEVERLRELRAKATPGPWEVDSLKNEGDYGSGPDPSSGYDSYAMYAANPRTGKDEALFDTLNSDVAEIQEDIGPDEYGDVAAWDAVGRANLEFLAALVNWFDANADRLTPSPAPSSDAMREALEPFARLEVPASPKGNAGFYSIFHKHILAARATLAGDPS